jgi:DNA-binding HxlR family transcriptional regulator
MESDLGKEIVRVLKDELSAGLVEKAQKAENPESAYGLLKESSGVIKAIEHLQFHTVAPKE